MTSIYIAQMRIILSNITHARLDTFIQITAVVHVHVHECIICETLMAVNIKVTVFCNVTRCNLVGSTHLPNYTAFHLSRL
jgi:hypothetical protein